MASGAARTLMIRRAGQAGRVLLWAVTLQLPARLKVWRRARQERKLAAPVPVDLVEVPEDAADIVIRCSANPVVSVVIPCYGQVCYTLRCLASIALHHPRVPFEVIVSEDASGDPAVAVLRRVRGIRLIEQPRNLGFLHNANAAAASAAGGLLFFLNNDTQVMEGWLDSLADLLEARPDAGAAGSKLIYPDGRLQEAGGIIWDDASGWNYGRLDHPGKPVYNYTREVDYVSGAALMARRSLFEKLGGFDAYFAPAYCEDSDLAFRLRDLGWKVLYQPRSVVVHFEGISHGTDLAHGGKAGQVINQRKFAQRWRAELLRSHFASGAHVLRARERARARRVVLVIDHYVPQPDRDAGSRSMWAFMSALLESDSVVKFRPHNGAYDAGYTEALQDRGVEVLPDSGVQPFTDWLEANGAEIDVVLLSRPDIARDNIADLHRHTSARVIYYGHDVHFMRMRAQAEATGDAALMTRARAVEALERSMWLQCDVTLYPSDEETETVRRLEPSVVARTILPYAFATFGTARAPVRRPCVVFVAGFAHPPNEDGAVWFASKVFPLVTASVPAAELLIIGSNPASRVRELASEKVSVHANVTDRELSVFYAAARVAVVPLRFGAGVKLKVIEALREGVPLVTTPVGAQGCAGLEDVVPVCSGERAFADAVCTLLRDDDAWNAASARQIDYARGRFSLEAMRDSVAAAFEV